MELQGTIYKIMETQTFDSGFQKRTLILNTEGEYPQPVSIEFLKDKTDVLNSFKVGDKVSVAINIQGRKWSSPQGEIKYFNTIVGWKINKVSDSPVSSDPQIKIEDPFEDDSDPDSSLPF
jgi:hypothetical protein